MVEEFIRRIMTYGAFERAFTAAILVGLIAGIIGAFVILRGLSLMGDAISHSVIPGVAISHLLNISYIIGASVFGLMASILIGFIGDKTKLKKDTTMGIVFSAFFALGIVMDSQIRTMTNLQSILFGNVLTVSQSEVDYLIWIAIGLVVFVVLFYKELLITSFDETMAQVYGLKTKLIQYGFLLILTLVIVLSLQAVGAVLIVAMIITPAATAYLLTNRMHVLLILSATLGVLSSMVGVFLSLTFSISSGAAIVLTASVFFLIAFVFAPKKGLIAQWVGK